MRTVPENAPSSTTTTANGFDCEPDDEWKQNLRKRIEEGLQSMVEDAKENHATELSKAPDTAEAHKRLEDDYKDAMQTIRSLAADQFKLELDLERNQRRWTAGVPLTPGWSQYIRQEQQNIMNNIKQSNQSDNSVRSASESPAEERRSSIPNPSNEPPALAPTTPVLPPVPPSPSVRPAEEREKSFVSPRSVRRGSDVRSTMSGDRDDFGSFSRRNLHTSVRPSLPEHWVANEIVDEPEEFIRSPPPRARAPSIDRPSHPSSVSPDIRLDSSLGRSSGSIYSAEPRSPPRSAAPPEVWKPAISPAEDAALPHAKPYNLGRRGSTTSMRSTGSGASIRPSITETIPERVDDGLYESDIEENDYGRVQETTTTTTTVEPVRPRVSTTTTDKSRDKDKRPLRRRNSRQTSIDGGDLDHGLRSDDRHRSIDSPGAKPPPYYEYREQPSPRDSLARRDQQVHPSPQDQRPIIPSRSSYGGDDREYSPQYSTPHSTPHRPPHGPKPPPYFPQRESRPISRQASFTRHLDFDDDNDIIIDRGGRDQDRDRDRDRDRERHWERDYDRDRDRDSGGRDIHSIPEPRRSSTSTSNSYSASRGGGSSRPAQQDYEDWEGAPASRYNNNHRSLPSSDNLEHHRRPESARPGPGLSRQPSYVRPPRDDPDRRYSVENDGYSSPRQFSATTGSILIPRHTSSLDEQVPLSSQQPPAWRGWGAEGNRRPNFDHHQRQARSPPEDTDSEGGEDEDEEEGEEEEDEDDNEDDDDDGSEEGAEAKQLRELEARKQRLEMNRKEADDELRRMELEIKQLAAEEARKKKEEEDRRDEVRRKEEEAKRREEEARKKEEDIRKLEEEVKRKEEDAAKKAKQAKRMEELAKKKEAEAKRKEKDARLKELDAKKKEEAAKQKVEEARQKAEELSKKEEEAKQREAQLEQDTEKTKKMQLETQKIAEDLKKKEEEANRKDLEMKEREDVLRRREEELMRREADNFRREQEAREEARARKREEELKEKARKDEEAKEAVRRDKETRKEKARQEEAEREEMRKMEEARWAKARREEEEVRESETRKKEEAAEARKKAADAKREEDNMRRKLLEAEEAKRNAEEAAKRREEDFRRREEARLEGFRREQEEKRIQNASLHFEDMFFDVDPNHVDSKLMDEQVKVLQQAEFRKRMEDIRRTREERKRNDSVGNDSAWANPSYLSNSPGTSPSMSRSPPQFNGPSTPERSAGPPSGGWGAGPAPAWGPSIKQTATASSPTASRPSASTSTGKPRTGSVNSGTHPTSGSPHTASFSEAERTRKQQEFAESQQEQFRRAQEKLEAERQLKTAGRPLSKEELQRVFDHHERLWTRLNTLDELSWNDFPWPMTRHPSNPDDMSLSQISAYIQSPLYPDKDKTRTPKDRIKEHIKRWHPDRFETKLLPKVVEDEREKVKHGAGNVARYLSDLLRKENESNTNNIFGD